MSLDERRTYFDAEPWYRREGGGDWYQQNQASNEAMAEILLGLLGGGVTVLEIGCGGGWLAERMLVAGVSSYLGIDFAESAVLRAAERLSHASHAHIMRGDALSREHYQEPVDLIVGHQFLHCLIGKDRALWLTHCASALFAQSGRLVTTTMVGVPAKVRAEIDADSRVNRPGNRFYAEVDEVRGEVEAAGFTIEQEIVPAPHDLLLVAQMRERVCL